jgi:gliding motility-associated lipoprotein GldH
VTATSPDGKTSVTDTLQYDLADEQGRWYGRGFGDIHELKLPFRQNVFFPKKGTYHFKIQHGMRTGDLKGVYDIGVRVEKTGR